MWRKCRHVADATAAPVVPSSGSIAKQMMLWQVWQQVAETATLTSMTQTIPAPTHSAPWVPTDATFGARLALIRQHMHWGNIAEAAKECGVPVDSWRNWEVDGREPRRMTVIAKQIATRTGCDYLWLVHGPDRGSATPPTVWNGPQPVPALAPRVIAGPDVPRRRRAHGRAITTRAVDRAEPTARAIRPESRVAIG